jgi:hypothetical protein
METLHRFQAQLRQPLPGMASVEGQQRTKVLGVGVGVGC